MWLVRQLLRYIRLYLLGALDMLLIVAAIAAIMVMCPFYFIPKWEVAFDAILRGLTRVDRWIWKHL